MTALRNPLPSFDVTWPVVVTAAALQFAITIPVLLRLEVTAVVALAGLAGGAIAGAFTSRYGPALNNGLVAGALGGTAAFLVMGVYGSYASWRLGLGLDSVVAAQYGFRAVFLAVIIVPIHAIEGGIAAVVANGLRRRVNTRHTRES